MKIQTVGGSSQQRSLPFNAERTINLFPITDQQGADSASFLGTPGLLLFGTAGNGAIRGEYAAANGRGFVVSGSELYEMDSSGTATLRGTLNTSSSIVTMADNGFQLGICDGEDVYMLTYATNVFAQVTDPDLPSAGGIDFIDGYFVINENNTGKFFISGLYNGTTWAALDFASAESSPDLLMRAVNFVGQLGLFGKNTLEIWRNTGDSTFPFARISGSTPVGTISPYSIISIDTSVYWVGSNSQGSGIVYKAQGFNPVRISTDAIEIILQRVSNPELLRSWTYQQEGHVFLVVTGSDLETSLCYDISTGVWHERAFLNTNGQFEQHRGSCSMYLFNKHLIGDRVNGNVYELSLDVYTDNLFPIKRQRVYTHLIDELKDVRYSELNVGFETGGVSPQYVLNPITISNALATDYRTIDAFKLVSVLSTKTVIMDDGTAWTAGTRYLTGHDITISGCPSFGGIPLADINTSHELKSLGSGSYTFPVESITSVDFNASSFTISSGMLGITANSHGMADGDRVIISNATDIGGITASQINGTHTVFNVSTNKFYIMTTGVATSYVASGGGTTLAYQRIYVADEAIASLEISKDGARTWSSEFTKGLGRQGDYKKQVKWRRLGVNNMCTFRLSISDAAKIAITGSYLS